MTATPLSLLSSMPPTDTTVDTLPTLKQRAQAALAQTSNVPSPCISVCRMDTAGQWCTGCLRSLEEIAAWSGLDDAGKRQIWGAIVHRAS